MPTLGLLKHDPADGGILHKADGDIMHDCCCGEACTVDAPSCAGSDFVMTLDYSVFVPPTGGTCWAATAPSGGVPYTMTYIGLDGNGNYVWRYRHYTNNYCVHHSGAWLTSECYLIMHPVHDPVSGHDCEWEWRGYYTCCVHVDWYPYHVDYQYALQDTGAFPYHWVAWTTALCNGFELAASGGKLGVLIEPAA